MKQYIKGSLKVIEYASNFVDLSSKDRDFLNGLCNWGFQNGIDLLFGIADDNSYVCEYKIVADTTEECINKLNNLKELLSEEYQKITEINQIGGETFF